jgi:hypothetical protein
MQLSQIEKNILFLRGMIRKKKDVFSDATLNSFSRLNIHHTNVLGKKIKEEQILILHT